MGMSTKQAREYFNKHGIEMGILDSDYYSGDIIDNYVKKYGDWKVGNKIKFNISLKDLKHEIVKDYKTYNDDLGIDEVGDEFYDEWDKYEELYNREEIIISGFFNVGAVEISDFDYGMCLWMFSKV